MKKICESLREHAMNIISFKTKNEVINKRAAKMKCKNLLHFFKKIEDRYTKVKEYCKIRNYYSFLEWI